MPTQIDLKNLHSKYEKMLTEIHKTIYGQDEIIKQALICIFSGGHTLLVGVPGLAKTLLVNCLAKTMGLSFKRIQFTPDLMPSDIIGAEILDSSRNFKYIQGPVFTNILLADEINRTPPKTQAALLEAMQERAITVAGVRHPLPKPFFVLATQNPIEQEGTYPLPEAQLDRFMFNLQLDYPTYEEEIEIVKKSSIDFNITTEQVLEEQEIEIYRQAVSTIPVTDHVIRFAVSITNATRPDKGGKQNTMTTDFVAWGAGPRASLYLIAGAKTNAVLNGRYTPEINDIIAVAKPVLRHRIVKNFKAEAEEITSDIIIDNIIETVKKTMSK